MVAPLVRRGRNGALGVVSQSIDRVVDFQAPSKNLRTSTQMKKPNPAPSSRAPNPRTLLKPSPSVAVQRLGQAMTLLSSLVRHERSIGAPTRFIKREGEQSIGRDGECETPERNSCVDVTA